MEFQFKKNVKIVVSLEIGDKVCFDNWGPDKNGKTFVIEDMKMTTQTESCVSVKLIGDKSWYDSTWFIKQENPGQSQG